MDKHKIWFFSWVAYDSLTGDRLLEYSGADTFNSDQNASAHEVFERLVETYQAKRDNIKIHCIAFNSL